MGRIARKKRYKREKGRGGMYRVPELRREGRRVLKEALGRAWWENEQTGKRGVLKTQVRVKKSFTKKRSAKEGQQNLLRGGMKERGTSSLCQK